MTGKVRTLRLLLLEDNTRLQELLGKTLREAHHAVDMVGTIADFRIAAEAVGYDLFIVDLGLPDGDGITLIRELRSTGLRSPILVITARIAVDDRIAGLDCGADDYLNKPFSHLELLARVRALLRRPPALRTSTLQFGRVALDETTGQVWADGSLVEFRPSERRLLALLLRRAGTIVPRRAIEDGLSEFGREVAGNAVETLVSRVRKGLRACEAGVFIETIRGIGYALREDSNG